ncbi:hypothetical protein [Acidovorax carolinensis]|uniref:hypothetical protein n=1 Tax=Acidovorax carolinensis TaxID=553814 RepID=UPI0012FFB995|nr:hypothetical protein [Acidovorax carolinensis]
MTPDKNPCKVYLDAEFTNFENPELLSIALCAEHGPELYLELDLSQPGSNRTAKRSSDFTRDVVLSQLGQIPGAAVGAKDIGNRIATWIQDLPAAQVVVVYDFQPDYDLLERALRESAIGLEAIQKIVPVIGDFIWSEEGAAQRAEKSWEKSEAEWIFRHHALADARALRAADAEAMPNC